MSVDVQQGAEDADGRADAAGPDTPGRAADGAFAPWPLIAYATSDSIPAGLEPMPSSKSREWINSTPNAFARRCLPLMVANQAGWVVRAPIGFRARWNGSAHVGGIELQIDDPEHPARTWISDHFGAGIVTFQIPYVFRTPPGINLLVRGAPNFGIDGIHPLEGLVETDWSTMTFTMNWRILAPHRWVRFNVDDPICFLQPISTELIEAAEPAIVDLSTAPDLESAYRGWSASRQAFNADAARDPKGWQKDYFLGRSAGGDAVPTHRTRVRVAPFAGGPLPLRGKPVAAAPPVPRAAAAGPPAGPAGGGSEARWQTVEEFYDHADHLRAIVEDYFDTPESGRADAGVWEVFHVKDQYAYLRTPARRIVPDEVLTRFVDALSAWGWANLGVGLVTDPFLSLYPPGCGQGLHNDAAVRGHAYVHSLSREITGGATLLLRTDPYWNTPRTGRPGAGPDFVDRIDSKFNRLLVFDSRLVHGVDPVQGAWNPHQARLVLHGQFVPGGMLVTGNLEHPAAASALAETRRRLAEEVPELVGSVTAALGTRLDVDTDGRVTEVTVLSSWVAPRTESGIPADLVDRIVDALGRTEFPSGPATVTVCVHLDDSDDPGRRYVKRAGLDVDEAADGFAVTDPDGRIHRLNPSAMLILDYCTGDLAQAEIADLVRDMFGLPQPPHDLVRQCLGDLLEAGLVTVGDPG